ncbi:Xyloglucan endotransglucosylase/hydrolase protein 2 [Bienertia sinuspersici]
MSSSNSKIGKTVLAMLIIVGGIYTCTSDPEPIFDENYGVIWGYTHVENSGTEVQMYLDESSGAGFESKQSYGSGFFTMRIKLPANDSGGVVIAYYLTSPGSSDHDELDFEFLGNRAGKPYTVQTNVFANGDDNIPIRYFRNNVNIGVNYPSKPMKVEASIWDGSGWATDGGQTKIIWSDAPFRAYFEGFNINGCPIDSNSENNEPCISSDYWWNQQRYWELNPTESRAYQIVKHNFVIYDYCTDTQRYPVPPPECSQQ